MSLLHGHMPITRGGSATPKSKSHRLHVRVGAVFGTKSSAAARQSPVLRRSSLPVLRVPPLPSWAAILSAMAEPLAGWAGGKCEDFLGETLVMQFPSPEPLGSPTQKLKAVAGLWGV